MIVNLRGGLGNQILQVAYGVNCSESIYVNEAAVNYRGVLRNYCRIRSVYDSWALNYFFGGARYLISKLLRRPTDLKTPFVCDGYFQYGNISQILPDDLRECLLSQLKEENEAARARLVVHVRGGDYLLPKNQAVLESMSTSYYVAAIEKSLKDHGEDMKVIFVSNDLPICLNVIEKVKARLGVVPEYISGDEWADFSIISQAEVAIIPNSTFSMTARMLNPDGHTYAPKSWFTEASGLEAPLVDYFNYL